MKAALDLRVLASFLVVAEELSFTRAARRLHMTQPPLSLQIKQLEEQLDTRLFERTKRSVRLTAAGDTLRTEAEKLFAVEHRIRQLVARVGRGEEGGQIGVGFTAVASLDFVPGLLRSFDRRRPGLLYSLKELSSDAQLASLLRNEIDVALVRPPVVDARLEARLLMSEPQVLAIPAEHPLASRVKVRVGHLHREVVVAYERRTGRYVHDLMMRWLTEHDVTPLRYHDVVHHNALMAVVSAGLGLAVVPSSVASRPVEGVVFKRFAGAAAPKVELWVAVRKQTENPIVAAFVDEAVRYARAYRASVPP